MAESFSTSQIETSVVYLQEIEKLSQWQRHPHPMTQSFKKLKLLLPRRQLRL
jgi:hypothetical protein